MPRPPGPRQPADRHLTNADVRRLTGLGRKRVKRLLDRGEIPSFRVPGTPYRRVSRAALRRYLVERDLPTRALDDFEAAIGAHS